MASSRAVGAEWAALRALTSPASDAEAAVNSIQNIDWDALLALAEEHGVMQALAAAAPKLAPGAVPAEVWARLAELQRSQAFFTLRMSAELFRLAERFAARGIAMLVMKGPALAVQAYGDAAMRQYGDLDLLVRDADLARATELMTEAGYQPHIPLSAIAARKIPGQYMFRQTEAKLLVELHNDRTMRYYPRGLPLEKIFSRSKKVAIDGREMAAPCVEDHLVMICVHGAKHFWERLLWIADVAALLERHAELDWELARATARDAGAETMLHGGLLLAGEVLGARVPAQVLARAKKDVAARRMAEQVLGWLPAAGEAAPGLLGRARYRTRMGGGGAVGARYLWRLLFSPTEEDWEENAGASRGFVEVLKRPFRLAKRHGGGKE
jgi:hypothetical protein